MGGDNRLVVGIVRDACRRVEVVDGELFFELPQFRRHLFRVWVRLPLLMRQRLLCQKELVKLVCDVEVWLSLL